MRKKIVNYLYDVRRFTRPKLLHNVNNKISKRTLATKQGERDKMNYKIRSHSGSSLAVVHVTNFVAYYEKSFEGTAEELIEWRDAFADFMTSTETLAELRNTYNKRVKRATIEDDQDQDMN
jgi:hypothetical protein